MENTQNEAKVPTWFGDTFTAIGSEFVEKDGEVAADTPWGAGYIPKRKADMNATNREQVDGMLKRYEDDEDYTFTDAANGTKTITHTPSGFSVNEDNFMLTADAEGKYEVASMFDIGMMTGALTEGKANMDIQRAIMGVEAPKENAMAPATSKEPTQEEEATGKAMLEVDQSGATPPTTQQPGAPIAGKPTEAAMPTSGFADAENYNVKELDAYVSSNAEQAILQATGLKPTDKNYNDALAAYTEQVANKHFKKNTKPPVSQPEPKQDQYNKPHWNEGTERKRAYQAKEGYSNNYGNYKNDEEYNKDLKRTLTDLQSFGKITAKDDALFSKFSSNREKYGDLGIATPAQVKAYEADLDIQKAKSKTENTLGYAKMKREEDREKIFNEAVTHIDKAMDEGGRALDSIDLTRSQARKVNATRKDLNTADRKRMTDIKRKASTVRNIQNMLSGDKLESLEKASPAKRAKAWINSYFGDMSREERKGMIAKQGMDKLVSDTVKEISGAAASDQERDYIHNWLLGKAGMNVAETRRIMNKIQKQSYEDAQNFGDKLYDQSDIGWVQHLKESVGDLSGMTDEDIIGGK